MSPPLALRYAGQIHCVPDSAAVVADGEVTVVGESYVAAEPGRKLGERTESTHQQVSREKKKQPRHGARTRRTYTDNSVPPTMCMTSVTRRVGMHATPRASCWRTPLRGSCFGVQRPPVIVPWMQPCGHSWANTTTTCCAEKGVDQPGGLRNASRHLETSQARTEDNQPALILRKKSLDPPTHVSPMTAVGWVGPKFVSEGNAIERQVCGMGGRT